MLKLFKLAANAAFLTALLVVACYGQQTTGTVTLSGTVSKFVEINSGGAVTLSGNSGGSVVTDGTANSPLAVVVDLGELGPSNTSSFVTASVPLKLRSNAAYVMTMAATFSSTGSTVEKLAASDIGFGLGTVTRSGVGVATGTDTNGKLSATWWVPNFNNNQWQTNNLTDELGVRYEGSKNRPYEVEGFGRRFMIGLRATF